MNRINSILVTALAVTALLSGCKKPETEKEVPITIEVSVTGIADNNATVSATVTGNVNGGKIVAALPLSQLTVDYEQEILLINFIENNGEAISQFPYTATKSKLLADVDYITAALVYDKNGIAKASAYKIWTAEGVPDGWSQENSAGTLNPNQW